MMQEYDLQQPEFLDERGSFIVKLYKSVIEQKADEMDRIWLFWVDKFIVISMNKKSRFHIQ